MSVNDSLHREDAFERYLSRSIAGLEGEIYVSQGSSPLMWGTRGIPKCPSPYHTF